MANIKSQGSWYVDTADQDLSTSATQVMGVLLTATAANGRIVLSDATNAEQTRIDLRVATSGQTETFLLGMVFPNGIRVTTLTNAVATIIGKPAGSSS